MSRSPARFTQSDVRRVLTAAQKAKCAVRVEIEPSGKIVVLAGPAGPPTEGPNPWEAAMRELTKQQ